MVLFDFYANGTTLAKSGAHSANNIRLRLVIVKGVSKDWHEINIAPTVQNIGWIST